MTNAFNGSLRLSLTLCGPNSSWLFALELAATFDYSAIVDCSIQSFAQKHSGNIGILVYYTITMLQVIVVNVAEMRTRSNEILASRSTQDRERVKV